MNQNYKPVVIESLIDPLTDSEYRADGYGWYISNLIVYADKLEPFDLPLCSLCLGNSCWRPIDNVFKFAIKMKRVLDANLDYPIILSDEGYIMDGHHRIVKALIENRPTIKAVRFDKNPKYDFTYKTK